MDSLWSQRASRAKPNVLEAVCAQVQRIIVGGQNITSSPCGGGREVAMFRLELLRASQVVRNEGLQQRG